MAQEAKEEIGPLDLGSLRPIQALAASVLFRRRRLLLSLPRQFGGKTELGVRLSHDLLARPFTKSALFLAKDKKSGKKATREKFERIFSKDRFHVNTENVYLRDHKTSCLFMDSVDKDPDRIRGGTYALIHWSEVAFSKIEHGETIVSVFEKVFKPTLELTDGYCYLESTNNGKNGWYDLWNDAKRLGFATLKIGLGDMVYMGLLDQETYDRIRGETHPDVFRQEYECDWVTFQGKTYPELDEHVHVDVNMAPPQHWQYVVAGIDWGWAPSATCVLFGYVEDDVLNVFDEHYALEELPKISAEQIAYKRDQWRIAHFACTADHEADRNAELTMRGIECGLAAKTNVMGARMQIKEALYFNKIKIHPRCKYLLRDLDAAVWHDKKEGELDDTQCTWGHFDAEAALRYLIRAFEGFEVAKPHINPHASDPISAAAYHIQRTVADDHDAT